MEDDLEHRQEQLDRRAAAIAAFDAMDDECQEDALCILESFAKDCPRRMPPNLRLVSVGDVSN